MSDRVQDEAAPDRAGRPTPYELIFGAPGFDAARFEDVRAQAGPAAAITVGALLHQPAAGALLRELVLPATGGDDDPASYQEIVAQTGALLFHAYRFWLHGRAVYELSRPLLEANLGEQPASWTFRAPVAAGYVQLPHQLFWARVADDAAPEPVDGFFWSAPWLDDLPDAPATSPDRLDLLLVLGLRRGRPGVSLVDIAVEPAVQLEQWAALDARPDGEDFSNILPGGELQGYRALTTRAEAVKLATICFRLIDTIHATEEDAGTVRRVRVHG